LTRNSIIFPLLLLLTLSISLSRIQYSRNPATPVSFALRLLALFYFPYRLFIQIALLNDRQ
ncbi:hypothetical protein, partial [Xenorhabdus bovienii]|uniref:hypothetical protein n=1 Tax=Xenorhabdus bovienii TaxID=40576 RepID=UPI0023B2333D